MNRGAVSLVHNHMTRASILLLLLLLAPACGDDEASFEDRPATRVDGVEFASECAEDEDCGDVGAGAECCTGGKCSPDGWCSPRCESDQDCPEGFFCIDHDGSRCFMECADDRDCPLDWECEEKNDHFTCRFKD